MKNLKKAIKNIKDDKRYLIFYGALLLASLLVGRVIIGNIFK